MKDRRHMIAMDITPLIPQGYQVIQSYGDGGFRVTGVRHEGSVLVFKRRTLAWPVARPDAVTMESLAEVTASLPEVEILLIGTGPRLLGIPPALRRQISGLGISVDVMDTGAACRTYNVLMTEDRRVAAALIAVG